MVVLHCTRKLLARLPKGIRSGVIVADVTPGPSPAETVAGATTRLGDWYANLMTVARRPLVLAAAERSLFAVVVPLAESRTFIPRWRETIERRLLALDIAPARVAEELSAMAEVLVVPTSYGASATSGSSERSPSARAPSTGRRMVGVLNDMAWQCEGLTLRVAGAEQPDIAGMERALDRLLCTPLDYHRPDDVTRALFEEEHPVAQGGGPRLVR